jgi:hypothetical protein
MLYISQDDAKALFRKGVDYELEGFHYEAMRCYKRALKLDPDVEKKVADEEFVSRSSMDTTGEQATQLFMWNGFDLFSLL